MQHNVLQGELEGLSGALTHAAPELLAAPKPTCASDIYAYGVLMYELITGLRPYQGCSSQRIVALKAGVATEQCLPLLVPAQQRPESQQLRCMAANGRDAANHGMLSACTGVYRACVSHDVVARPTAAQLFQAMSATAAT
jgi:serine/threonine protein kinase